MAGREREHASGTQRSEHRESGRHESESKSKSKASSKSSSHRVRSRSRSRLRERDRPSHRHRHGHRRGDGETEAETEEERRERKRQRRERERREEEEDDEDEDRERRRQRRGRERERESERERGRDGDGQKVIDESERGESTSAGRTVYADVDDERYSKTTSNVPTSESLDLRSHAAPSHASADSAPLPESAPTETPLRRDDWMLGGSGHEASSAMDDAAADEGAAGDRKRDRNDEDGFFDSLGTYSRTKAPRPEKPNPDDLKVSSRELNTQFAQGKKLDEYEDERSSSSGSKYRDGNQGSARGAGAGASAYGGPGHQWRMMKLRRVYEAAEEEGRDVKEVALERYGSRDDFDEARRERQFLDDQQQGGGGGVGRARAGEGHVSASSSGRATPTMAAKQRPGVAGGFMYSDSPGLPSRPQSRQSFRKPGEASAPSTPLGGPPSAPRRFQQASLETDATASSPSSSATTTPKPSTPIPSVFTPTTTTAPPRSSNLASSEAGKGQDAVQRAVEASDAREADSSKAAAAAAAAAMDPVALNKLSAKVMRAEMSGAPNAVELRERLERETERAKAGGNGGDRGQGWNAGSGGQDVQVLPTLDARGRLYDVGTGKPGDEDDEARRQAPGNRRKKADKFETRDKKTGEVLRYNADDDEQTLADLVRQERFGAGRRDQKDMDAELASRIMGDKAYKDDVDYVDDNVERLSRKKVKSDGAKREFAIQDFAKTKKALDSCNLCWQDEGQRPPRTTVVCSGTRCYLALSETEPLTRIHLLVVPIQHHVSSLEADDDTWEEIKNFIKCLMQLAAQRGEALMIWETVKSVKRHKHTFLEAIVVSRDVQDDLRGYFQQAILQAEGEWSQHKKLITFTPARPFRRSLVPQLPYFMVQWDHKGEKGYGHVIEDDGKARHRGGGEDEDQYEDEEEGQEFPAYFAAEVVGNVLDLEPGRWRKPRRMQAHEQKQRLHDFKKEWEPFDWTKMLDQQSSSA